MSNEKPAHTPLPWRIAEADKKKSAEIVGANEATVARLTALDMPNARRIVAALNATQHISTEQLESGAMLNVLQEAADLRRRIAELEKELEEARPKWKVCPSCMGRGKRDVAHGVTAPCKECSGAKVLAVEPQTNGA